jgi:hypothetical protein
MDAGDGAVIRMLAGRLLLLIVACLAALDLLERFNPTPPPLFIRAQASACDRPPPAALLPRDRWEGSQIKRSKDGGTA